MAIIFFIIVIFFIIIFLNEDTEHQQKKEKFNNQNYTESIYTKTGILYPDIEEFDKAIRYAWKLRRLDIVNDNLDSQQQNFASHSRKLMLDALQMLLYKFEARINILDKNKLHSIALECLDIVLNRANFSYVKPFMSGIYMSVVDEAVEECKRGRLRKALANGDENLRDLVKMVTKNESNRDEIDSIAKSQLSENSFDLYNRTIRSIYDRIPYSYYGICQAIKIRDKGAGNRTEEEETYLSQYIEYFDRASHEIHEEQYAEYN